MLRGSGGSCAGTKPLLGPSGHGERTHCLVTFPTFNGRSFYSPCTTEDRRPSLRRPVSSGGEKPPRRLGRSRCPSSLLLLLAAAVSSGPTRIARGSRTPGSSAAAGGCR